MQVLIIGNFMSFTATKPLVEVYIGLKRRSLDVVIMTASEGEVVDYLRTKGVTIIEHHPQKKIDKKSIKFIRSYLIDNKPDILFLLNSKSIANGIKAAKNIDVKVVTYRGAAGLYWHDPTSFLTHLNPRVDKVVCLSHFVEKNVSSQMPYMKEKTVVISHGFDPEWYQSTENQHIPDIPIPEGSFVISCIANHRSVKGTKYFIRALNHLPDIEQMYFLLVGNGMAKLLRKEIVNLQRPERISAVDYVEDITELYKKLDVIVQPSLKEGLGKAIAEAMCLGKPVIAAKSGGPEELIENGKSGFLVNKKSSVEIAEKIQYLFDNEQQKNEMGHEAKKRITTGFSIGEATDKYYRLFKSLATT
jgi:glycosyltransferase involved in cell wall biosynthesis